jgi:hypothetical protein
MRFLFCASAVARMLHMLVLRRQHKGGGGEGGGGCRGRGGVPRRSGVWV